MDDCSTDGSPELVERRYAGDERVRVIRQAKNGGPGVARNTGIEQARGRYITFCDSDDQIKPECYERMYAVAERYDADVVHASGCLISMMEQTPIDMLTVKDEDWCAVTMDHPEERAVTVLPDDPQQLLEKWLQHAYHWAIWNKLYRRELLMEHGIRFGRMRLAEDQQFCFSCLFHAKKYVMMPGFWYCYRQVADSACRGRYDERFMVKALRADFEVIRSMEACGRSLPWFTERPEQLARVTDYICEGLEEAFIRQIYWAMGEEAVRGSEAVHALFRESFGELAPYAEKQFHDAHRLLPKKDDIMALANSPAGLRGLCAMGIFSTLKDKEQQLKEAQA